MGISEHVLPTGAKGDPVVVDGAALGATAVEWAEQTRRILTRDLLTRASRATHGEGQALRFRALHLNLPLVATVAEGLGLTDLELARIEHAALDGLHEAVRLFDPYGEDDFADFATPFVAWQIRTHLLTGTLRPPRRRRPAAVRTISRRTGRATPR